MSQTIYFGTYTKKESKGIYKAQFDPETGTLSLVNSFGFFFGIGTEINGLRHRSPRMIC